MYITPTDQMSTAASEHHIVIMGQATFQQLTPTNTRLLKKLQTESRESAVLPRHIGM